MSTRYRTTYHGILLGLLLHVIMAQAVNAQRSISERLDYFRSLGERTELELEEIRTPIVSYQALMDSITQRILTEQCSYIVYPAELGNAFTFVINRARTKRYCVWVIYSPRVPYYQIMWNNVHIHLGCSETSY